MADRYELVSLAEKAFQSNSSGAAEQIAVRLADEVEEMEKQVTLAARALEAAAAYITAHDCDPGECFHLADWQDAYLRALNAGVPTVQLKTDIKTDYV